MLAYVGAIVWGWTPLRTVVCVFTTAGWVTEISVGLGAATVGAVWVVGVGVTTGVGAVTTVWPFTWALVKSWVGAMTEAFGVGTTELTLWGSATVGEAV